MESHATRICEACGTIYPPDVEWCPRDNEPTVPAMIVRSSPSGRHAPHPPAQLAENFRPSLSRMKAVQMPQEDFFNESQLPPEESTSVRISVPPPALYQQESSPRLSPAPILTSLQKMRSFTDEDFVETRHQRPTLDQAEAELATNAVPREARRPQRAPTPAPNQSQRRQTVPEDPPRASQRMQRIEPMREQEPTSTAIPVEREKKADSKRAATVMAEESPMRKKVEPTQAPIQPEKKQEPRVEPKAREESKPPEPEPERALPVSAPSLSINAVPLAYDEPPVKPSLRERLSDTFGPLFVDLKESAILRLIAVIVLLLLVSKGIFTVVSLVRSQEPPTP